MEDLYKYLPLAIGALLGYLFVVYRSRTNKQPQKPLTAAERQKAKQERNKQK